MRKMNVFFEMFRHILLINIKNEYLNIISKAPYDVIHLSISFCLDKKSGYSCSDVHFIYSFERINNISHQDLISVIGDSMIFFIFDFPLETRVSLISFNKDFMNTSALWSMIIVVMISFTGP